MGQSAKLQSAGLTNEVDFSPPTNGLQPTIWAILSTGAQITYQIEATPDGVNWIAIPDLVGLTQSIAMTLNGNLRSIRGNVTSYGGGSLQVFVT